MSTQDAPSLTLVLAKVLEKRVRWHSAWNGDPPDVSTLYAGHVPIKENKDSGFAVLFTFMYLVPSFPECDQQLRTVFIRCGASETNTANDCQVSRCCVSCKRKSQGPSCHSASEITFCWDWHRQL